MEATTEIIISSYPFTEDNQATMTNNKSDNANGKGKSSSPTASNSTDVSRSKKKKKRNEKKNKSNNNNTTNTTKKEVFKGTAKDGTMLGVVVTIEVGNIAGQYRI